MTPVRVAATDLDAWLSWRDADEAGQIDLAELLKRLRRQSTPSDAMLRGRALHWLLERAAVGDVSHGIEVEGVRLRFDCEATIELPPLREAKAERDLGGGVVAVGKVDAIIPGARVWDHKLTERIDLERYFDSFQWRFYLWLFDCPRFTYNVFVGSERDGEVVVSDVQSFDLYSYVDMAEYVESEIRQYANFYRQHVEPAA